MATLKIHLANQAWNDSIKIYFIMHLSVFPAYMPSAHEVRRAWGLLKAHCVCWKPNSDPPEQQMLLTTEPLLQTLNILFLETKLQVDGETEAQLQVYSARTALKLRS